MAPLSMLERLRILKIASVLIFMAVIIQKHTKISSEEISDGRKYSLLFRYDKVEVSC